MTEESIGRYFTSLGKSYYKSPDFLAEQKELKDADLICTPISTFGVGVLSCFMIAETIEVKTLAKEGTKVDFHVTGPGSLFWAKEGTRDQQGTDVKIWLKPKLNGKETKLGHEWSRCLSSLRKHFGYPFDSPTEADYSLDPGEVAARHVVWPKYPVYIQPPQPRPTAWTIDGLFHVRTLAPLNAAALIAKGKEWDIPLEQRLIPTWGVHDWDDRETGSRVRLWFPQFGLTAAGDQCWPSEVAAGVPFWKLAALAEPQLEKGLTSSRCRALVQSMYVDREFELGCALKWGEAPGTRIWLDLRGPAAPRLKADRSAALIPEDPGQSAWGKDIAALWERYGNYLISAGESIPNLLLFGMPQATREHLASHAKEPAKADQFTLDSSVSFLSAALSLSRESDHEEPRDPSLCELFPVLETRSNYIDHDHFDPSDRHLLSVDQNLKMVREWAIRLTQEPAEEESDISDDDFSRDVDLGLARRWHAKRPDAKDLLASHFVQEGFWPSLRESWPPLRVFHRQGQIGEAFLTAPVVCKFAKAQPEATVLEEREYDLCFPLTAIRLARLRREAYRWVTDRDLRLRAVLPFLFPGNDRLWSQHGATLRAEIGVDSLYALIPAPGLWWKRFTQWTAADLRHLDNISILWNLSTGEVLACRSSLHREQMKLGTKGVQHFTEFAELNAEKSEGSTLRIPVG